MAESTTTAAVDGFDKWVHAAIALLIASAGVLFWHQDVVVALVNHWLNSATYTHGILILPISLWLVWQKRASLSLLNPTPAWSPFVVLIGAALLMMAAVLVGVKVVQQFTLIAMIAISVWIVLGHRVAGAIIFPLFFMFAAVPMGRDLVPPMMEFTATFTVTMLQWSGIPVFREGLEFVIPSGSWSVIEACSGLRYLIASATLGLLYAYLTYRSIWRRLAFILLSIIVPVVANGLRAYMIVMIGHLSGMKLAVGVDHLLYGWVFFGIVMLLLFWIGSPWSDLAADTGPDGAGQRNPVDAEQRSPRGVYTAAIAITALVGLIAVSTDRIASFENALAETLRAPSGENGWVRVSGFPWQDIPATLPTQHQIDETYRKGNVSVGLALRLYPAQRQESEAVSAVNLMVAEGENARWTIVGRVTEHLGEGIAASDVTSATVKGAKRETNGKRMLLWQWYRMGTIVTANDYLAKLYSLWGLIASQRTDGTYVLIGTDLDEAGEATEILREFAKDMGPAIDRAIDRAALGDRAN